MRGTPSSHFTKNLQDLLQNKGALSNRAACNLSTDPSVMLCVCLHCSVKPAVFDLFLGIAIALYLALVYLIVQVCLLICNVAACDSDSTNFLQQDPKLQK